MEKQTLINYGWIIIVTLIAAVFIVLATPLAEYIGTAITNFGGALLDVADGVEYENAQDNMEDLFEEDVRVPLN